MMMKRQAWSGREAGGVALAVLAVLFCIALGVGVWAGTDGPWEAASRSAQAVVGKPESKTSKADSPFYCNTKSLSKEEWAHKSEISAKMRNARVEIKELVDGYAFRYRPEGVSLVELADWVASEAKCCPFFAMGIEVERDGGPVWLTLRGPEGVKQFIWAEFKLSGK